MGISERWHTVTINVVYQSHWLSLLAPVSSRFFQSCVFSVPGAIIGPSLRHSVWPTTHDPFQNATVQVQSSATVPGNMNAFTTSSPLKWVLTFLSQSVSCSSSIYFRNFPGRPPIAVLYGRTFVLRPMSVINQQSPDPSLAIVGAAVISRTTARI